MSTEAKLTSDLPDEIYAELLKKGTGVSELFRDGEIWFFYAIDLELDVHRVIAECSVSKEVIIDTKGYKYVNFDTFTLSMIAETAEEAFDEMDEMFGVGYENYEDADVTNAD